MSKSSNLDASKAGATKPGASKAEEKVLDRRKFLGAGAAVGVSAAAAMASSQAAIAKEIAWDREVDIVVIGAGASGLPAAIAARDAGAEVIVIDHHFDVGGIAIMSGGDIRIGGGNRLQMAAGIKETPDDVYKRWTDPLRHRFADFDLIRRFADENVATFDFLEANGVNFDLHGTEVPREGRPGLTNTPGVRPHEWPIRTDLLTLDQNRNGSGIVRPLEHSARDKGVEFLLSHTLRTIHREQPFAGRVLGVTVETVDRWFQPQHRFLNLRARKAVIICSGGHGANVHFRRMFDPRLTEEYQHHGHATAPATAASEICAMSLGAALWSCGNETDTGTGNAIDKGRLAVRDNYVRGKHGPESAVFFRHRALGLDVRDWQDLILVKETGLRFWNEIDRSQNGYFANALKPTGNPKKLMGGGPIWAIFDSAAVERERWQTISPHVDRAGGYFFSGATLEELAGQLTRNIYQKRPMPGDVLRRTVERFNGFVVSGKDDDFNRPSPPHKIEKPPFFAAWATPCLHDSYTGLRTNPSCQVMDMQGRLIPGLFCAGESQGGIKSHGLGRCIVTGRVAGMEAAKSS
jgi:urocanate reductase